MNFKSIFLLIALLATSMRMVLLMKKTKLDKTPTHRIAIFQPVDHPTLEIIKNGFITKLTEHINPDTCFFNTYNAQGNSTLARSQAETIIEENYDICFTIGAQCTQLINTLISKRNNLTTLIFGGVDKHVMETIFTNRFASEDRIIRGVVEQPVYEKELDAFIKIKPTIKNILLVYNPNEGGGLEQYKKIIITYLSKQAINCKALAIFSANELTEKVPLSLNSTDAVLVLKDNTVVQAIDLVIKLCNTYKIPLFVSDLNSGQKGASVAFGFDEIETGYKAAELTIPVIKKEAVRGFFYTEITNFLLVLNKTAARLQNLIIDENLKTINEIKVVIHD